ncbi:hypothetical protein N9I73_03950 [Porticoccaceae bacterium]|nr:hypothetical protein [Porticoccaceae bacterium]MDA9014715.1 hypothetical protein [Porticoccaceae bacterium]
MNILVNTKANLLNIKYQIEEKNMNYETIKKPLSSEQHGIELIKSLNLKSIELDEYFIKKELNFGLSVNELARKDMKSLSILQEDTLVDKYNTVDEITFNFDEPPKWNTVLKILDSYLTGQYENMIENEETFGHGQIHYVNSSWLIYMLWQSNENGTGDYTIFL